MYNSEPRYRKVHLHYSEHRFDILAALLAEARTGVSNTHRTHLCPHKTVSGPGNRIVTSNRSATLRSSDLMSGLLRPHPMRSCIRNISWPCPSSLGVASFNARHVASEPSLGTSQLPPACPPAKEPQQTANNKWGSVIYRCTHKDDQTWNRFKQKLYNKTQRIIAFSKGTTDVIKENHEWRFVEDPISLDGATKAQLRARFKQWRNQAAPKDLPRDQYGAIHYDSEYRYFIQVDEHTLNDLQDWGWNGGSVNLVDVDWLPLQERFPDEGYHDDDGEYAYDPVEGCTEEDVGWMMIAGSVIDAKLWGKI